MMYRWIRFAWVFALMFGSSSRLGVAEDSATPFVYVCKDAGAGGYQAFPDVCRLQDGRLMVVFYAGYRHVSLPNAQWPKGGRICYCTSDDDGHSWSKAETLYDGPDDDRDPSIVQLKDGRMICDFFSLRKNPKPGKPFIGGSWIVTSDDFGKTWSSPRKLYDNDYYCSSPIRELSDGRLILPLYHSMAKSAAGAVGISDDGGKTWSKPVDIDSGGARLDAETDVIQRKDGSLYAIERCDSGPMCYSISKDNGNTWSVSKPIGFNGHCPYLHRTRDGIVILGYRHPVPRPKFAESTTALRYSRDECQSWSDEVLIDKVCGAYPSMVNLKDGSVLVVYYEESPVFIAPSAIRAERFRASPKGIEWLSP